MGLPEISVMPESCTVSFVLITGAPAGYNGAFSVTPVTGQPTKFTYTATQSGLADGNTGKAIKFNPATHGFHTNDTVQLSGITDISGNPIYNGVVTVTGTPSSSTFTFNAAS